MRKKLAAAHPLPPAPSLAKSIGPSFILLGLALGSGELILWPYLAATWGLGLLWGGLLGISLQFVLNTEVMRYTLAWGESVFVGLRRISIFFPLWFIISTFIPWSLPGFSSAASQIFAQLLPILPEKAFALFLLILTGVLLSAGKTLYNTMETYQRTIILLGLPCLFILTFVLANQSDWQAALQGLVGIGDGWRFFPPGVALASFLGAFAYSGAGGNLNLAQSYYIKEKGMGMGKYGTKITSLVNNSSVAAKLGGQTFAETAQNKKLWKKWWMLVNFEHGLVFWLLGFISIVVLSVLARATVFGEADASGIAFLYQEAAVIGQRTFPFVSTFFLIISGLMLFSTQVGVLESSSRIISENALLLRFSPEHKVNLNIWFYIALWGQIILGIIILLIGIQEPRFLLTLSALLNAAAMMVAFGMILLLNLKRLKPAYQPGLLRRGVMVAAVVIFAFFLIQTWMAG